MSTAKRNEKIIPNGDSGSRDILVLVRVKLKARGVMTLQNYEQNAAKMHAKAFMNLCDFWVF